MELHSGQAVIVLGDNSPFIRLTGPAIAPGERHKIEDALKVLGFEVDGGGTNFQDNLSDIFLVRAYDTQTSVPSSYTLTESAKEP